MCFTLLEILKSLMYDYHFNVIQKHYDSMVLMKYYAFMIDGKEKIKESTICMCARIQILHNNYTNIFNKI
ncbi:hypothetical protein FWK35_00004665 [Aphis craccivora]|uniref:Uncharacterized protein n=1 Tax=Aphis craccivora TaxID=307492 RepID=A0A6G0ZDF4_APHCR|nr:hypothetical protein FWK35_00004665 [Aphis craccivora]